ncbi:RHS repeat domain-containing protein [Acinetobacter haemolyticus]|uniref:RHS repeat-associated core domain-containing protein n=1 Tax=Acinetobacter haemolyticus TaxID=29430 RepID=A0AAW4JFC0_ACIHA|nr:RHS repeat-associated core domain-containing protein [Acinetobacter haemolyticus]MBO3658440.1 RHS repeat-associated core domain-containing protein [Acinetobacter haemolyticus]
MKNNISTLMQKTWLYTVHIVLFALMIVFSQTSSAKDRIQYHVQNFDGSTIKVINEQGIVSQSYQYAPFGQQLQLKKPSNLKNPNAFVGGVQDAGDLVYLKHRHYNPVLGRFYQPDPITFLSGGHGQTNRYQYGWNDTYVFSDPTGMVPQFAPFLAGAIWLMDNLRSDSPNPNNLQPSGYGDAALIGYGGASLLLEAKFASSLAGSSTVLPLYTFMSRPTTVYRTMSETDFLLLKQTGKLPASGETFISPNLAYARNYNGVTVEFQINQRFYDEAMRIATRDSSKAVSQFSQYSNLPLNQTGWVHRNIVIKSEEFGRPGAGGIISIGLGKGPGLDIFNKNIIRFREIPNK